MQFLYLDSDRQAHGPYSRAELQELFDRKVISEETAIQFDGDTTWFTYRELTRAEARQQASDGEFGDGNEERNRSFREQTNDDWRVLKRHILVPWEEVREMRWLDNRRLMGVAAIGLFPLLIIALFIQPGYIRQAYWATAFYFSVVWAVFFYYVFPAPGVTVRVSLICFFGTGVFSVSILKIVYYLMDRFLDWRNWMVDSNVLTSWAGWVFGVGVPEELCKMLVLFYLVRNYSHLQPQTMLYYGLMAGLGFGIYEGVNYQERVNPLISSGYGDYYIFNVVRLTALPFIHAIWTAIAGYFIGYAYQFPERKRGLIIIAIVMPSFLHGNIQRREYALDRVQSRSCTGECLCVEFVSREEPRLRESPEGAIAGDTTNEKTRGEVAGPWQQVSSIVDDPVRSGTSSALRFSERPPVLRGSSARSAS